MKNILAGIIALTTVLCTFTGCGSTDDKKAAGTFGYKTKCGGYDSKEERADEYDRRMKEGTPTQIAFH